MPLTPFQQVNPRCERTRPARLRGCGTRCAQGVSAPHAHTAQAAHTCTGQRAPRFSGDDMETIVWPELAAGKKYVFWLNQDEACFCTSGGMVKVWVEEGKSHLTPKRGESIMVSGIVSPFGIEHTETIEPGAL